MSERSSGHVKERISDVGAVLTVARKDLLLELRSKEVVVATLFFSGLVLVILAFALGPDETALRNAAAGTLWTALAFAGVISAAQSYQGELEEGALEQLLLYPVPRATLFLGKLLANWLFMLALGVLLLPVSAAVFGGALAHWPRLPADRRAGDLRLFTYRHLLRGADRESARPRITPAGTDLSRYRARHFGGGALEQPSHVGKPCRGRQLGTIVSRFRPRLSGGLYGYFPLRGRRIRVSNEEFYD